MLLSSCSSRLAVHIYCASSIGLSCAKMHRYSVFLCDILLPSVIINDDSFCQAKPLSNQLINPLECKGYYSATSNNMKLVHWPLISGLFSLHLVQRGGDWAGPQSTQARPRCAKPTNQQSVYQSPYCDNQTSALNNLGGYLRRICLAKDCGA